MRAATTIRLAILALLLSAYAYFFERSAAPWEGAGRVFPDLDPAEIVEIEVSTPAPSAGSGPGASAPSGGPGGENTAPSGGPGGENTAKPLRLRKEGSPPAWWIVEPIRFEAFHPKAQSMAYDAADLARIADAPPGTEAFPKGPELIVRLESRGGGEETIEIGADHPDPQLQFTYCRVRGEVFVIRKEFRKVFIVSLEDLRSRALVQIPLTEAAALEVEGDPRFAKRIERDPKSSSWRLRRPMDALADRELMEDLLNELNSWSISEFLSDAASTPADLEPFGLVKPRAVIAVESSGGRAVRLEVGRERDAGLVSLRPAGTPHVFAAPSKVLERVLEAPEALRSRFVFDLGLEEIESLRGEADGRAVELKRLETGGTPPEGAGKGASGGSKEQGAPHPAAPSWRVSEPATGRSYPGDRERIESLLVGLRKVLILKFTGAEVSPEVTGLSPPRGKVELLTSGGRKLELHLGLPSEEAEDRGLSIYHVSVPGEPGGYLIRTELPGLLARGSQAFRKRDISELEPAKVLEVEVVSGDSRWSLMRTPGEPWTLSEETPLLPGAELQSSRVNELILSLHAERFRVVRFLGEPGDPSPRGLELESPRRAIILRHVAERPAGLFGKLVLGERVEGSDPAEFRARFELPDLPPFTVPAEVSELFDAAVEHLRAVTGK